MFMTSSAHAKGSWLYRKPNWETRLDELNDYEVERTGLSKEKLYQVLEVLVENGVISDK